MTSEMDNIFKSTERPIINNRTVFYNFLAMCRKINVKCEVMQKRIENHFSCRSALDENQYLVIDKVVGVGDIEMVFQNQALFN